MKLRLIIFLSLFLQPLYSAISYTPSIALSAGANTSKFSEYIDESENYRTNLTFQAEANPLSFRFGEKTKLSFPLSFALDGESTNVGRTILQPHMAGILGFRIERAFTSIYTLGATVALRLDYFMKVNASYWFLDFTLNEALKINESLALIFPITFSYSDIGWDFDIQLGISVHFDSFFRGGDE